MTDDILLEATRALQQVDDGESPAAETTRAGVMQEVHAARRRRVVRPVWLIPLAAVLIGTAAAAAEGGLGRLWVFAFEPAGEVAEPLPVGLTPPIAGKARRVRARLETAPGPEQPSNETGEAPAEEPPGEAAAPSASSPPSPAPAGSGSAQAKPAAADPGVEPLYVAAHNAHFRDRDYQRALAAWDAYLADSPRGRFALEASYNRALCLMRLGRYSAGRQALEPFAAGRYGGYRRQEAQDLLDAASGR